jgi:hypothetical protein
MIDTTTTARPATPNGSADGPSVAVETCGSCLTVRIFTKGDTVENLNWRGTGAGETGVVSAVMGNGRTTSVDFAPYTAQQAKEANAENKGWKVKKGGRRRITAGSQWFTRIGRHVAVPRDDLEYLLHLASIGREQFTEDLPGTDDMLDRLSALITATEE